MFVLKNTKTGLYFRFLNSADTKDLTLASKFTFGTKQLAQEIVKNHPEYKLVVAR